MGLAKDLAGIDGVLTGSGPAGAIPSHMRSGATEIRFPRGAASQYPDVDPIWHYGYLFSPALTLGGGTFAVQRNIVAEQVLGTAARARCRTRDGVDRDPHETQLRARKGTKLRAT